MKFVCDKCNTRYSIADDRVHGRVLKIRCKSCNHVITVREPQEDSPSQPMAQVSRRSGEENNEHTVVNPGPLDLGSASPGDSDEWYVSFDGEQEGPFPIARAVERVKAERPRGKEIHCWRPGFFVWLPIEEVPEFVRLLEAKAQPPRIPITATSKPVKKDQTGPKPALKRDGTGPRPALGQPGLSLDDRPMPLPPPPESAPMQPLGGLDSLPDHAPQKPSGGMITKPESKVAYRRAEGPGVTPSLGAKALADAPAKKPFPGLSDSGKRPALPSLGDTGKRPALSDSGKRPALPSLGDTGKRPSITDVPMPKPQPAPTAAISDDVSPFAAALAAAGGDKVEARSSETGPVPLPPPPEELPIGEASGLLNLTHLASASAQPRVPRAAVETFGGQTVTPPPTPSNGAPTAPQPVVVVAGPVPHTTAPWMKLAAIGGLVLSLVLGSVLVYVLVRAPKPPPVAAAQAPKPDEDKGQRVDDRPIAMVGDPAVAQPPGADAKKPAIVRHAGAPKPKQTDARPPQKGATIITGSNPTPEPSAEDEPGGHALHVGARGSSGSHDVSGPALAQVVTQNQRSLGLCYERVLKHDNTLKRAKVTTKVKVGVSGAVKSVTVEDPEFRNSEIGNCLVATMKQWHFPPNGEEYETEIPLLLQAN